MMLNFLYENYPFGAAEAFVEYEMHALADNYRETFTIYVLRKGDTEQKRYVPENARISFVENASFKSYAIAVLKMFNKSSLIELFNILKNRYPEGILKCVYRVFRYRVVAESFALQYKNSHRKEHKDTFVSYWLNECAFALSELKKKYPDIKIGSRGHGFDVFEDRCYMPFRKDILSGLDKIFLINKTSKQYFENRYGGWFDSSKIEISHLGVELPTDIPVKDDRSVFRIVTCSTVIPLKRLDLLIDAFSGINDKKIEWVHLGGGPLLNNIKEYAQEKLKNSSVVYSFLGQMALKDIHNYYSTTPVHLFINCSDTEGTPVSVMEAMSYGIPTIARNVGGMNEVVDNTCGILLPTEENAALLRSAIKDFCLLDSDAYSQMRQNARAKIKNEFTAEKTFEEYIKNVCSM